jgi:hypothetical protein
MTLISTQNSTQKSNPKLVSVLEICWSVAYRRSRVGLERPGAKQLPTQCHALGVDRVDLAIHWITSPSGGFESSCTNSMRGAEGIDAEQ